MAMATPPALTQRHGVAYEHIALPHCICHDAHTLKHALLFDVADAALLDQLREHLSVCVCGGGGTG